MRASLLLLSALVALSPAAAQLPSTLAAGDTPEAAGVNRFFVEALSHGGAYANLEELTRRYPGRLAGSRALQGAVDWAQQALDRAGADRVYTQAVQVPHWERGAAESVVLLAGQTRRPLAATMLGSTVSTPKGGLTAEVVEVQSLEELQALGLARVSGRIVFFNRPMNPAIPRTPEAYAEAGDQRNHGPAAASRLGAVAVLTRSLTLARDDVPHTGNTTFPPGVAPLPAAALGILSADALSAALAADPHARVALDLQAKTFAPAPSHNVIGEIRGAEFPNEVIVVGGHLDAWDITAGAHDDGAGVVQSIEVLRLFKALGIRPRHTVRCVLFTNEENGHAGANRYAEVAQSAPEKHVFALETDNGGFAPTGFNLGNPAGDAHLRAQRWLPLYTPWGIWRFIRGAGGADVNPLLQQGAIVGGLTPDSPRYFDYHHAATDTIDKVNPRELHLGAAALASLIWLVDTQGL